MTYDPQTSAACPRMSPHVQFPLKIRILYLGVFRWTNPNGGQNGGQPHSQTKRRGTLQRMTSHRAFDVTTNGFRSLLQQFGRGRCAAMLYLDRAFKAHLRLDQLHVVARARDRCFRVAQPTRT